MGRDDWFRNTTWTPEIATAFFQRLARSRGPDRKAQYLRIQALHLAETKERRLIEVALCLLDRLLTEYPTRSQLQSSHLQRAQCLVELGRDDDAIVAFRASLAAQRDFPNVHTDAWLDFAWFAVERERLDLYAKVSAVLDEFARAAATTFPIQRYKLHAARAVMLAAAG